ncbi:MAG: hypothetical protein AAF962_19500 [Actinomycetota bacterium]
MGVIRRLFLRRFRGLGLLSDLFLVGAAGARLARARRQPANGAGAVSPGELALAGGAAFRLLRRLRRSRKAKRLARTADVTVE